MYNIDTAFLGHLGTAQLAGTAMASLVANLVSTFLYAPAYGLNSLCAQAIGAGNPKLAGNWLQLSLAVSAVMLIPSFILLFFVKYLVSPFEHDENVLHYASLFGRYSTCFLVPTFIYMAIRQYFQSLQIVHPATIVSLLSVAMNVFLNQILIYGLNINLFHGAVHIQFNGLGFIGSPLATTCSLVFQLTLFSLYAIVYKKYPQKAGAWGGFTWRSFEWSRVKNFFKVIGPMMIGDATENWSYQTVILTTGSLPDADVAANTVIFNIWGVFWSVFWGIGLATIVRSGKAISNGDVDGVKLIMKISLCLSIVVNGIISSMCYIFRKDIAKLYTSSEDVIEILEHALPILSGLFFVGGLGWIACGVMEGMARNVERSLVYSVTSWLMFVPGAIYFGVYSPWSKKEKWSAICWIWKVALIVEIIRCVLIWIILWTTNWQKQVRLAKQRSEALKNKEHEKAEATDKCDTATSPKTRALIQNEPRDDGDSIEHRTLTAWSLHELPNEELHQQQEVDVTEDTSNVFKTKPSTDVYLRLN